MAAALGGALLLTRTERVWPDMQEAVIGAAFILGATGSVLVRASNLDGSEHLRDLLVGDATETARCVVGTGRRR